MFFFFGSQNIYKNAIKKLQTVILVFDAVSGFLAMINLELLAAQPNFKVGPLFIPKRGKRFVVCMMAAGRAEISKFSQRDKRENGWESQSYY